MTYMQQLTVSKQDLARRVGELRAVCAGIEAAAVIEMGGNFGPGDIDGAARAMAERWKEGLEKMRGKIDQMAEGVESSWQHASQADGSIADAFRPHALTEPIAKPLAEQVPYAQQDERNSSYSTMETSSQVAYEQAVTRREKEPITFEHNMNRPGDGGICKPEPEPVRRNPEARPWDGGRR